MMSSYANMASTHKPLKPESPAVKWGVGEEHPMYHPSHTERYEPKICNSCGNVITDYYIMKVRLLIIKYSYHIL